MCRRTPKERKQNLPAATKLGTISSKKKIMAGGTAIAGATGTGATAAGTAATTAGATAAGTAATTAGATAATTAGATAAIGAIAAGTLHHLPFFFLPPSLDLVYKYRTIRYGLVSYLMPVYNTVPIRTIPNR